LGSTKAIKNSPFNFTATPFTVGFDDPCGEWDCKLSQSSDFVRFAILYADTVALPNEFDNFIGLENIPDKKLDSIKHDLIGKILVLWQLEDIVSSGIGTFIPNDIVLCEEHGNELENAWDKVRNNLEHAAIKLQHSIARDVNMSVTATPNGIMYEAELPDKFFLENWLVTRTPEKSPEWLTKSKKFKKSLADGNPIKLSKGEIEQFGVVEYALLKMMPWIRSYMFSRVFMTSKYLTNRPTDAILFDEVISDHKLQKVSRNIQDHIPLKIPIIVGADTKDLLRVRQKDHEAFINYRANINAIEQEFRNGRNFTEKDAQDFYEDVVYPSLQKLESKAESIKHNLRSSVSKKIIIASTFAGLGISLGFIPNDIATVLQTIGACEVINAAAEIWKSSETPTEIRNEPFYFLWKVNKHSER